MFATRFRYFSAVLMAGTLMLMSWPSVGYADHVDRRVIAAVHEFHRAAEGFHELIHHRSGFSDLSGLAHELSDAAGELHEQAEHGASYYHLRRDFGDIRSAFRRLDRELNEAYHIHHSPPVHEAWRNVAWKATQLAYLLGTNLHNRSQSQDPWRGRNDYRNPQYYDRDPQRSLNERSTIQSDTFRLGPFWFRF